jgi:hypothetical protein
MGGGCFLYTRAIKNKQSSETGRTQDTEQGQTKLKQKKTTRKLKTYEKSGNEHRCPQIETIVKGR